MFDLFASTAARTPPAFLDRISDHIMWGMYLDFSRYLIAAGAMFAFLLVFKTWANNRRIQERRAKGMDYRREFVSSLRTVFFFAVTTISILVLRDAGIILLHLQEYSLWLLTAQVAVMIIVHDAYFYWLHRAMHHPKLFRPLHLHHHKSRTPTPFTAYSFSVGEAVLEAAYVPLFLLATSLMGIAYAGMAVLFFIWIQIIRNVMQHAGVELHPAGWVDSKWTDWISTTTHHDLHHSEGRYNYGFYFTFWDRWMGTEHPEYKQRFREAAKPLVISRRVAEKVSVTVMALFATLATLSGGLQSMGVAIA
ncbi:sterol desaturase family protein [Altererythrobacter sp. GH1-8]|uniref:sterol desaturase family protein n=1 Tax=Altererythrobacter sp. GH1-8 TaxID=3349333 RepID=UPI00374D4D5B